MNAILHELMVTVSRYNIKAYFNPKHFNTQEFLVLIREAKPLTS
jgi:hypothetical protein